MKICAVGMIPFVLAVFAHAQIRPETFTTAARPPQNQTSPAAALTTPASASERANIDPAKEADIRRLMDVMGAKMVVKEMMDGMEKSLKPMMANSLPPGDYRDKLVDLFFEKFHSKADLQQLVDMAVPGYDKYLADDEIKGLIVFYQTPLGRRALEVLPKLSLELQSQGAKWGQDLGRQCMLEVLSEHPDLAQALAAAGKASRPQ